MALGRMADARLAFLRAESIAEKIGNAWRFDALAGLARVALEAGELDEAVPASRICCWTRWKPRVRWMMSIPAAMDRVDLLQGTGCSGRSPGAAHAGACTICC